MQRFVLILCILLLAVVPVWAADDEDTGDFFGLDYGGDSCLSIGYLQLNLEDLKVAIESNGYPALSDGMLVYGASTLMGFRDGLRWSAFGYGGEMKKKGANDALSFLEFSAGGLNLDYGFIMQERFDISVGAMLGGGGYELTLREGPVQNVGDPNKIYVKNVFFVTGPRVNMDFQVTDWLLVQVSGTYMYGLGDKRWSDVGLKTDVVPSLRVNGLLALLNFVLTF